MRHSHLAMVLTSMGLALGAMTVMTVTQPSRAASPLPFFSVSMSDSPVAAIMLDGQPDINVARFTLHGGRENFVIHTLTLFNCPAVPRDSDGDCSDDTETLGSDAVATTVTMVTTGSDNATQTSQGVFVNGVLTFSDLALQLDHAKTAIVDVRIATAQIDDATVTSGMQLQISLNARTQDFSARLASGRVLAQTDVIKNFSGNVMTLRNTKPTLSLSTQSPSGYIAPGFTEVLRVDATAAAEGDVIFDSVAFTLTSTDNANTVWNACKTLGADSANFKLVNTLTNTEIPATWMAYRESGSVCTPNRDDVAYLFATLTAAETIPAGTTTPYALYVQTIRASALQSDTIYASLPTETELANLGMNVNVLVWSDGTSAGNDIDASIVEALPVIGNTLIFHTAPSTDE